VGIYVYVFISKVVGIPTEIMMDQKQPENVEYFSYLGNTITHDARCTCEIKCSIAIAKAAFTKKTLFCRKLDLNVRSRLENCYICSIVLCGADSWTLRK
jgi:hypothetical protein